MSVVALAVTGIRFTPDNGVCLYCPTIFIAREFVGIENKFMVLLGVNEPGDGAGGFFFWNPESVTPDDNGVTTIEPYSVSLGAWNRLVVPGGGGGGGAATTIDGGVTATGVNRTGAYAIFKTVTIFDTVPFGTGAVLPPWSVNRIFTTVATSAANNLQVYGNGTDTLNGVAGATGLPVTAGSVVNFAANTPGAWKAY